MIETEKLAGRMQYAIDELYERLPDYFEEIELEDGYNNSHGNWDFATEFGRIDNMFDTGYNFSDPNNPELASGDLNYHSLETNCKLIIPAQSFTH